MIETDSVSSLPFLAFANEKMFGWFGKIRSHKKMCHWQQQTHSWKQPPLTVIAKNTRQAKWRDQQQHQIVARTQCSHWPATGVFGRTFSHVDEKHHFSDFNYLICNFLIFPYKVVSTPARKWPSTKSSAKSSHLAISMAEADRIPNVQLLEILNKIWTAVTEHKLQSLCGQIAPYSMPWKGLHKIRQWRRWRQCPNRQSQNWIKGPFTEVASQWVDLSGSSPHRRCNERLRNCLTGAER